MLHADIVIKPLLSPASIVASLSEEDFPTAILMAYDRNAQGLCALMKLTCSCMLHSTVEKTVRVAGDNVPMCTHAAHGTVQVTLL